MSEKKVPRGLFEAEQKNDWRHVAAVKIYIGLMLLSQAELIKVGLAISLVMEAKRPDESKWSFEGCRCSLCGEDLQETNRFKRAIRGFRGSGREHVMYDLMCEMSDDMKGE